MNIDINSLKYRTLIELRTWKIKSIMILLKRCKKFQGKMQLDQLLLIPLKYLRF